MLFLEIRKRLSVVAVNARVLDWEPDVSRAIFVKIPRFGSVDSMLSVEMSKQFAVESADAIVMRSEPDVSVSVLQNTINRVVAQTVFFRNLS